MSNVVAQYIAELDAKVRGVIKGTTKLTITDEGILMLDEHGARAGDGDADVTLMASDAVFKAILSGDQNPVMAYMSGKLKVDGNAQRALKVSSILTD
ncbi:SCP-2 sterol transfer family protein [Roseovarius albus]|uniref:SCP-2 sterol transfer family protein n=1 Tax=Roseovarius albus TaxID=1247867 RepID=A0A1X6ZNG1_9RHOB|nr:SCP2 sterol-binding domain-containing protein [Roseovarius albus]SLN56896.1 SCP-2 sterol transfer family protein [Roseovarius albus]